MLLEGRPRSLAAQTLRRVVPYDISDIPTTPLEQLAPASLPPIVAAISRLIHDTEGIRAALATKILHPKRPATVPVCDNQAIFGSFLQPGWKPGDLVRGRNTIVAALTSIHHCLTRGDDESAWISLHAAYALYQRVSCSTWHGGRPFAAGDSATPGARLRWSSRSSPERPATDDPAGLPRGLVCNQVARQRQRRP